MTAPSARDGLCACGCGQETRIGHDGLPRTWRKGHQPKPRRHSLEELFWQKVEKTDTCWRWTGCLEASGYGKAAPNPAVGSTQKADRIANGYRQCRACQREQAAARRARKQERAA